jgi:acyl-CoA thioesterase
MFLLRHCRFGRHQMPLKNQLPRVTLKHSVSFHEIVRLGGWVLSDGYPELRALELVLVNALVVS